MLLKVERKKALNISQMVTRRQIEDVCQNSEQSNNAIYNLIHPPHR